jgi:hypothetical protein
VTLLPPGGFTRPLGAGPFLGNDLAAEAALLRLNLMVPAQGLAGGAFALVVVPAQGLAA